jgi:hypothetical protein
VEKVIKMHVKEGMEEFLVKWIDYPWSEATWEPYENLSGQEACEYLDIFTFHSHDLSLSEHWLSVLRWRGRGTENSTERGNLVSGKVIIFLFLDESHLRNNLRLFFLFPLENKTKPTKKRKTKDSQIEVREITTFHVTYFIWDTSTSFYVWYLMRRQRRMCQQLRWVQLITPTSHNKRCWFIFTALPFYFSTDIWQDKCSRGECNRLL